MRRAIAIRLGAEGRPVGVLRYDQQGARESAAFEYAPSWLSATDRFALAPGLPLVVGPQFHRKERDGSVFHPAIADTEPDGWGRRVIQRDHAKRRQEARRAGEPAGGHPLNAMDYCWRSTISTASAPCGLRMKRGDINERSKMAGGPPRR